MGFSIRLCRKCSNAAVKTAKCVGICDLGVHGQEGHERARILVGAYSRCVTLNPLQRILQELLNPYGRIRDYSGDDDMSSKITQETTKKPTLKCNFPDCYASFKHKSELTRHRHLHNKTKAFECQDCHKKFKFHTGLQKHKSTKEKFTPINSPVFSFALIAADLCATSLVFANTFSKCMGFQTRTQG